MVVRASAERWNWHGPKLFDRMRHRLQFADIFKIEAMMTLGVAIHTLKKRKLTKDEGALSKNQFTVLTNEELADLESWERGRNAPRPLAEAAAREVLQKCVQIGADELASAAANVSPSTTDPASTFDRKNLATFMSPGRVHRGRQYDSLGWVHNVEFGPTERASKFWSLLAVDTAAHKSNPHAPS